MGCVVCQKFLGKPSLSRRDVELPRRDVKITSLCHVATWIYTSRRQIYISLPRRDVDVHVATSIGTGPCHVATWIYTSRRRLVMCSVTSRRDPERRDVVLFTLCDIATSPRTSRRDLGLRPKTVHFLAPHLASFSTETLTPSRIRTIHCWSSPFRPGQRLLHCSPNTVSHPLWPVLGHSGISTTVCPILAWV